MVESEGNPEARQLIDISNLELENIMFILLASGQPLLPVALYVDAATI